MKREFTGQYEQNNKRKKPIYVGDLVTLFIPRKERLEELNVFKVIKDNDGFAIIYHKGPMSETDPRYKQELCSQVYKVVGNVKTGIDKSLLK